MEELQNKSLEDLDNKSLEEILKDKEEWLKIKKGTTNNSSILSLCRPNVEGTRKNRANKVEVYRRASDILSKFNIKGNYIGLAAAYAPDIYSVLYPQITGKIVNCEKNREIVNEIRKFTQLTNWLHKEEFLFFEGDIFDALDTGQNKFSVIDLDLMNFLSTSNKTEKEYSKRIVQSLEYSTSNKFLLMIWSCYGRVITQEKYDKDIRKTLLTEIKKEYKLLKHKSYKYRDNHIPIKVEVLALKHRNLNR